MFRSFIHTKKQKSKKTNTNSDKSIHQWTYIHFQNFESSFAVFKGNIWDILLHYVVTTNLKEITWCGMRKFHFVIICLQSYINTMSIET